MGGGEECLNIETSHREEEAEWCVCGVCVLPERVMGFAGIHGCLIQKCRPIPLLTSVLIINL